MCFIIAVQKNPTLPTYLNVAFKIVLNDGYYSLVPICGAGKYDSVNSCTIKVKDSTDETKLRVYGDVADDEEIYLLPFFVYKTCYDVLNGKPTNTHHAGDRFDLEKDHGKYFHSLVPGGNGWARWNQQFFTLYARDHPKGCSKIAKTMFDQNEKMQFFKHYTRGIPASELCIDEDGIIIQYTIGIHKTDFRYDIIQTMTTAFKASKPVKTPMK